MNFAEKYKNEPIAFWKNILFTDESKFEILGGKKPQKVWRSVSEEFNDKCVAKTVKHGERLVMVWGCMTVGNLVFIESTMKKEYYLSILQRNITTSIEKLGLRGN